MYFLFPLKILVTIMGNSGIIKISNGGAYVKPPAIAAKPRSRGTKIRNTGTTV
jgi:hypothetical protein